VGQSNLSAKMADLHGEIGDYLGWGRGADNGDEAWSTFKQTEIERLCDKALQLVYFEATLDPRMPPHTWTWLNFVAEIVVSSGERYTRLPDDFGGFSANRLVVTKDDGSTGVFSVVRLIGEPYVDERYAKSPDVTGRPMFAADRARKGVSETRGTERELYIFPEPDAAYTLRGPYHVLPDRLTAKAPYTYGGADMGGCFIAACRAIAECHRDNIPPGAGSEWPLFQRSLAAAIQRDSSRHGAKSLGKNTDRSDPSRGMGRGWWSDGEIASVDPVTYDDTLYD
jgi:hypothetical protein